MDRVSVLRVNQLDARRLDIEISSLLRQQLSDLSISRSWSINQFQPEVELTLKFLLWRFTVWLDRSTPGQSLQNLRYVQASTDGRGPSRLPSLSKLQKLGFLGLWVVTPWLLHRSEGFAQFISDYPSGGNEGQFGILRISFIQLSRWYLRRFLPFLGKVYTALTVANFIAFLRYGVFSDLRDRVLGVRLVHRDVFARRQVAFEYMNRVMIWNGISEFLMTVMPLVDLSRVRRSIVRHCMPKALQLAIESNAEHRCGFCGTDQITHPMRASCGHVLCYYCLANELMQDKDATNCPHCSIRIESFRHA